MSRNLLHKTKLEPFKEWLTAKGIEHRPGRGPYQVLQVAMPRNQWAVVFDRDTAPEHYTVTWPLEATVRRFIRDSRAAEKCDACGGTGLDPACREEGCIVCGGDGEAQPKPDSPL